VVSTRYRVFPLQPHRFCFLFEFRRLPFDSADEDGGSDGRDCGAALLRVESRLARGWVVGVVLHGVQVPGGFLGCAHETESISLTEYCRVFLSQRRGARRLEGILSVVAAAVG
jgi:hypothetical protein